MLAGDEFYPDDVTSGPVETDEPEITDVCLDKSIVTCRKCGSRVPTTAATCNRRGFECKPCGRKA